MKALNKSERPLSIKEQRFVDAFFEKRDISQAAIFADVTFTEGKALYRKPEVRQEIDRRIELVEAEIARQTAAKAILDLDLIDSELKRAIVLDPVESGSIKLKAMEMGYGRLGVLRDGNFFLPNGEGENQKPSIFRASERTVKRVTEEVTERQVESSSGLSKVGDF